MKRPENDSVAPNLKTVLPKLEGEDEKDLARKDKKILKECETCARKEK